MTEPHSTNLKNSSATTIYGPALVIYEPPALEYPEKQTCSRRTAGGKKCCRDISRQFAAPSKKRLAKKEAQP